MPNVDITTKNKLKITIYDPDTFEDQENILSDLKLFKELIYIYGAHETSLEAAIELLDALMFLKINPNFLTYAAANKDDLAIHFTQDLSSGISAILLASKLVDSTLHTIAGTPFNIKPITDINKLIKETEEACKYLQDHEDTANSIKRFLAHVEPHKNQFADDGFFHALQHIKKKKTGELNNLDTLIKQGTEKAKAIGITKENKPAEFLLYLLQVIEPEFDADINITTGDSTQKVKLTLDIFKDVLREKLGLGEPVWAQAATIIVEHQFKRTIRHQKTELIFSQKELWKAAAFRAFARINLSDDLKKQINQGRIKEIETNQYGLIFTIEQLEVIGTQAAPSSKTTYNKLISKVGENIIATGIKHMAEVLYMFYSVFSPWLGKELRMSEEPNSPVIEITPDLLKEKLMLYMNITEAQWKAPLPVILAKGTQIPQRPDLYFYSFKEEKRWLCEGMYLYVWSQLPLIELTRVSKGPGQLRYIEFSKGADGQIQKCVQFSLNATQIALLQSIAEPSATTSALSSNPHSSFAASSAAASSSSSSDKKKAAASKPTAHMAEDEDEDSDREESDRKRMRNK